MSSAFGTKLTVVEDGLISTNDKNPHHEDFQLTGKTGLSRCYRDQN